MEIQHFRWSFDVPSAVNDELATVKSDKFLVHIKKDGVEMETLWELQIDFKSGELKCENSSSSVISSL